MIQIIKARWELYRARRAYKRADRAALRAAQNDGLPYGMWEALDDVRRSFGEALIDAEVYYLQVRA